MPKYRIVAFENIIRWYTVDAEDEDEAKAKYYANESLPFDSEDYSERDIDSIKEIKEEAI